MPFDKSKYPTNWKEISTRVKERAGWKCELCGVAHGAIGYRTASGEFVPVNPALAGAQIAEGAKIIRIVLTTAHHPDPNPMNCDDNNLISTCQRCHNHLDMPMRQSNARKTRAAKAGQSVLPMESIT